MNYMSGSKKYVLINQVKENEKVRLSFDNLAKSTFGLSFESWYQSGYWTEKYVPYSLLDGDKVVANVSVNKIDTVWQGEKKLYIQLGTVMTDCEHREQGLSRFIMKQVLAEWENKCDAVYLFANDSVLDFYPKFGFVKAMECQCSTVVSAAPRRLRKLDMAVEKDKALLLEKYKKSNPFSALPMIENEGLIMFYCSQFMKDSVYYLEEFDAIVIQEQSGENLFCMDIFCDERNSIRDILSAVANAGHTNVTLGFSPKRPQDYQMHALQEDDTTLFVLESKENIFADNSVMLPILSHA